MGAYLKYRVANADNATVANDILENQSAWHDLNDQEIPNLWFWTEADADELDFDYYLDIGEGDVKLNGTNPEGGHDAFAETLTELFETLHNDDRITVEIYAQSCAFGDDTINDEPFTYFTQEQVARISDRGRALTGDVEDVLSRLPDALYDAPESA